MYLRTLSRKVLLIAAAVIFAGPLALEAAKPIPVTVTAANPSAAIQGDTKTIKITGTGFDKGSKASFLVTGTTDASQIVVAAVRFNSSTELEADIQVQPSALTVDYDIAVVTSTGRKGKGTTLFKVSLDPSVIMPINLGVPTGCSSSSGTGLNDGTYPATLIVTADTSSCTTGKDNLYRWQNGIWYDLGTFGAEFKGVAEGVSDNGTVVGMFRNSANINTAVVVNSAGALEVLPSFAGVSNTEAMGISEDGRHVVGEIRYIPIGDYSEWLAARWNLGLDGNWNIELISPQQSYFAAASSGASDDGSVIVGFEDNGNSEGWVWMEGSPLERVVLGLETAAFDVSPRGEMIVGYRIRHNPDTTWTSLAVYWILDSGGNWVSHDLIGLDAEGSSAYGVGMVNGKLVIVGYGITGSSRIGRAVAWLPQPDGSYGAPIRLAAIDGKSSVYSIAEDVNANGVVVGRSGISNASNTRAVLWMLPAIP